MDESGSLRPLRLAALQLANDARSGRAELKREIAAGTVRVYDVLVDPPPGATGISLAALLLSQRGWGRIKTRRFLASNDVSETRKLGSSVSANGSCSRRSCERSIRLPRGCASGPLLDRPPLDPRPRRPASNLTSSCLDMMS